jgi:hypothetical protein
VPFSTFRGTLRQIDTTASGKIFDFYFPMFASLQEQSEWMKKSEIGWVYSASSTEMAGRGRERRFAGDETLDRGRYYALEDSPSSPPENNTLLREILAYASPTALVMPKLFDTTVDLDAVKKLSRDTGRKFATPALIMVIPPHGRGGLPASLGVSHAETTIITYPLKIVELELDHVLDLRKHSTLDWLGQTFVSLEEQEAENSPIRSFKGNPPKTGFELVPTLLSQMLGGGSPFIQGIGAWLRSHGANALIYPSARSDCFVSLNYEEIEESYGFILVDYRGSGRCPWKESFGRLVGWVDKASRQIEVEVKSEGNLNSWGTKNVLALQQNRYGSYRERFATIFGRAMRDLESGASKLSDELILEGRGALANTGWIGASIGNFLASAFPWDPEAAYLAPGWRYDGKSWFIHRTGTWDAEILVRCPMCGFEAIWPVLRGYTFNSCPDCKFSNGVLESRETIRDRFMPWAKAWPGDSG